MRNVAQEIQSEISSLAGVISSHVVMSPDGLGVDEIHVVATFDRMPKQIVRDIESLILNSHGIRIDHKVISIAQLHDTGPFTGDSEEEVDGSEAAETNESEKEEVAEEPEAKPAKAGKKKGQKERIRFVSAKSNTYGMRWEVTVELERGGIPSSATVNGAGTRQNKARLVAQATAEALNNFLDEHQAVAIEETHTVDGDRHKAVIVMLSMLSDRNEKLLVGSAWLEDDLPRTVVKATLDAVNRAV
jgi:hypothetical protein